MFTEDDWKASDNFGCVSLNVESKIFNLEQSEIIFDDVYSFDNRSHITSLYGILDTVPTAEVVEFLAEYNFSIRSVWSSCIEIFECDLYDVVKFTIDMEPGLLDLRESLIERFDHDITYPEYCPHVTLAYVKKCTGYKYIKRIDREEFKVTQIVYHPPGGIIGDDEITIPLGNWKNDDD